MKEVNHHKINLLRDAALECGMNPSVVVGLLKRMTPEGKIKDYTPKELLAQVDSKISMALEYMDPTVFANSSLKELGLFFAIMVDKGQLLRGLPTQILSVNERKSLTDLLPMLYEEAQKRGKRIEHVPSQEIVVVDG